MLKILVETISDKAQVTHLRFLTVRNRRSSFIEQFWDGFTETQVVAAQFPTTVQEAFKMDAERFDEVQDSVAKRTREYLKARSAH